ncbi:MAG TPA: hypothetical protein VGL77_14680 [Armatimonadota bacterium]
MRCGCGHGPMMHHPHGPGMVIGPIMIMYLVSALMLTVKMVKSLETLATAKALSELKDRLSDEEKAVLEARLRDHLFYHRCCRS